jgi:hypothetical protein
LLPFLARKKKMLQQFSRTSFELFTYSSKQDFWSVK